MDMKACGHAVVDGILPATSSSIQQWVSDGLVMCRMQCTVGLPSQMLFDSVLLGR